MLRPRLVRVEKIHVDEAHDERLDGIQRGEHPRRRARLTGLISRKQRRTLAADVQHDRARFEEHHVIVLIGRHLRKGLLSTISGGLSFLNRDQVDLIFEPGLFERPARAQIADQSFGKIRNPVGSSDSDHEFLLRGRVAD